MGGGDLNLKKSWHPTTMKNMERVWKAEQKHEAEQKKIEELQKELAEERAREEIRHFAEDQGVVKKKSERLDWMYEGVSALANKEEYLLGRAVDKTFEVIQQAETGIGNKPEDDALPESIFKPSIGNVTVDLANKIREDPLLMIKKQEDENRKKLLDNPIRMKQLADMLKDMQSSRKLKKEKKHGKKKRKRKHCSNRKNDNCNDSLEDEQKKNRKKKLKNSHHKTHEVRSLNAEQKFLLDSGSFIQDQMKDHDLKVHAKHNETMHVKHKYSNSTLKSKRNRRKTSKSRQMHSDSSSERDTNKRQHRHHRSESTDSSEDGRLHRKTSHDYKARRKERNEQKLPSEKRIVNSTIIREKQNTLSRDPAGQQRRSSSSESASSSSSIIDRSQLLSRGTSMISSRKQYGLIVRSNIKRDRKSRSRSPVKSCEKVTKRLSSSPDCRHRKSINMLDSRIKPSLKTRTVETKSFKTEKSSRKLDEVEKQRRLQEMMENAKQRDQQRSVNLKQHIEEEKNEALLQMKTAGTDFITPMLNKVADIGTVAERIKSNIYNIQRTKSDLNKNFAKR